MESFCDRVLDLLFMQGFDEDLLDMLRQQYPGALLPHLATAAHGCLQVLPACSFQGCQGCTTRPAQPQHAGCDPGALPGVVRDELTGLCRVAELYNTTLSTLCV